MKATSNSSGHALADHPTVHADIPHVQSRSSLTPPPSLDTVLIFLTRTVEQHYAELSVFPKLRQPLAQGRSGNSSIFYVTRAEADEVLAHAIKLRSIPNATPGASYSAHVRNLQAQIEEAEKRPAIFAAAKPKERWRSHFSESWEGTKAQLVGLGLPADTPFPVRAAAGDRRRGPRPSYRDGRGYPVRIRPASAIWPDWFRLDIKIPREVAERAHEAEGRGKASDQAKSNLAAMPVSADEYRAQLVNTMRTMVRLSLDMALKPATWHGYTLDEDAVVEIQASFDAVVEAVVSARVKFDSAGHAEIARRYRAQIAAADQTFQARLEKLTRSNPRLLEGGAQ